MLYGDSVSQLIIPKTVKHSRRVTLRHALILILDAGQIVITGRPPRVPMNITIYGPDPQTERFLVKLVPEGFIPPTPPPTTTTTEPEETSKPETTKGPITTAESMTTAEPHAVTGMIRIMIYNGKK